MTLNSTRGSGAEERAAGAVKVDGMACVHQQRGEAWIGMFRSLRDLDWDKEGEGFEG